ncbi:MAG: site-specific integrase [Helicobacteraceae bacterium]|nr:site-specific integrase [Helicobacteraceae bacterium]
MPNAYLKKLRACAHPNEVWRLMNDKVYPNSDSSLFSKNLLKIRKNSISFKNVTPPSGQIGLAYRTVVYLVLDGQMGDAPKNEGCISKVELFERLIRELNIICELSIPFDITGELIDIYICEQRENGLFERSIYKKLYILLQWKQHELLLPPFLRLRNDLFESSIHWSSLVYGSKREQRDYLFGLGSSKEPYPLDQLAIIMTEAIDYIETYADDCIIAAQIYKDAQLQNLPSATTSRNIIQTFRTNMHQFKEPQLKKAQQYVLSLTTNRWIASPEVIAPMQSCVDTIQRLQAVCVIVILMLTAMRKGELEMMNRYPKMKKTFHGELDNSFELKRLIYKTAKTENGESHSMAVPPIVMRSFYLLSYISEVKDGKQEGVINFTALFYGDKENYSDRINYLISSFCKSIGIVPPTSHQFRHAMAFLVAFLNDDIGIELAMALLGHKSIEMTKKYMGHYKHIILETFNVMFYENHQIQEAVTELLAEQSSSGLEKIIHAVEADEPLVGPVVKRLLQGFEFSGSITDEAKVYFAKSQRLLLQRGMLAVVEHPTHFCVRDLTQSEQMPCQIGLDIKDFINVPMIPSQCEPKCGCRLYTEPQVEEMKRLSEEMEDAYPDDLIELIKGNRFYIANSFEQTYTNVIEELEQIKQQKGEQHATDK